MSRNGAIVKRWGGPPIPTMLRPPQSFAWGQLVGQPLTRRRSGFRRYRMHRKPTGDPMKVSRRRSSETLRLKKALPNDPPLRIDPVATGDCRVGRGRHHPRPHHRRPIHPHRSHQRFRWPGRFRSTTPPAKLRRPQHSRSVRRVRSFNRPAIAGTQPSTPDEPAMPVRSPSFRPHGRSSCRRSARRIGHPPR